ncbi:MmgE/PrpD family protein [Shimia abyssi]|uniref:2-methylcitrate dehydratase PrpD n=1 Tax=Shimia abyssi TaxID=1662395 RepID=A0A2P8EWI0_9RHOB|nr:MmgE/PrpD family protein [Shimia abyssi]PSL13812.1 2-methylcitrate dehydratase PrpD [Shimia abyssi]
MPKNDPDMRAPEGTTQTVADYITSVAGQDLPVEVATKTKCHLLDTLAAVISGAHLKAGRLATGFIATQGGTPEATVWGSDIRTTAINAALANGISGHADETDDSHLEGRFHPGCAVVPAALAVGEARGASGKAVLNAVAAGYDIGARFSMALGVSGPRTATHSTHSLGALFGASAAASSLMGFDKQKAASALSYTIQQASGIPYWERDREHVEKAFDFGGMGARNGVAAALMVEAGLTGVQDPLEGKLNYLSAFAENPDADVLIAGLGTRFEIMEASIKKWCVGSPIQAALDAAMALLDQGLDIADIETIDLIMPDDRLTIVDNRDMPDVCLQHMVALTLIDGGASFLTSHDKARMRDPAVLALREKMTVIPSHELTIARPARQAILEIGTKGGATFSHHTKVVYGTPGNPMSPEDVQTKALELISPILGSKVSNAIADAVWSLEEIKDINALAAITKGE